jgi:hypothetical protein
MKKAKPKMTHLTYLGSSAGFKTAKKVKPIYMVTSVQAERYIDFKKESKRQGVRPRCWGWLPTLEEAKLSVKRNSGNMSECCYYSHAVIEEIFPGLPSMMFSDSDFQIWYEWKVAPKDPNRYHGKWIKCDRPAWSGSICSFCGL